MRNIEVALSFDMRRLPGGTEQFELYRAAIDMAAFADRIGGATINLMEHHGAEDGYLPQPFLLTAAMASVTRSIRFLLGAVILTFA